MMIRLLNCLTKVEKPAATWATEQISLFQEKNYYTCPKRKLISSNEKNISYSSGRKKTDFFKIEKKHFYSCGLKQNKSM